MLFGGLGLELMPWPLSVVRLDYISLWNTVIPVFCQTVRMYKRRQEDGQFDSNKLYYDLLLYGWCIQNHPSKARSVVWKNLAQNKKAYPRQRFKQRISF